jgi:hypothetical protein
MHYCEMESQGRLALPCDERATTKVEERWYCQCHADALEAAQARWSGINWFSLNEKDSKKKPDLNDADGRFWDEEE